MGYTLNEYGLAMLDGGAYVAGATEADVYQKLGLAWIPPELRENLGEIEAAEAGTLPELVALADIRGDLHMHTSETDGRATLEEMAAEAKTRGYEYIAITDHSKALAMANGLDEARVVAFAKQVRAINQEGLGIRVLSGLECDILRDGTMDIADDALAELDVVIASVHSYMNLESAEMTDRLLRAIENPHVKILGHPTGRQLLHRESYPYDFEQIASSGRQARRRARNQREPRAARPRQRADSHRQSQRRALYDFHRRASPQAPGQHAVRRGHGAARVADQERRT